MKVDMSSNQEIKVDQIKLTPKHTEIFVVELLYECQAVQHPIFNFWKSELHHSAAFLTDGA